MVLKDMKKRSAKALRVLFLTCVMMSFFYLTSEALNVFSRAGRLLEEEKYKEALEELDKALEKRPDDAEIEYNKAVVLYRKGAFDLAEEAFVRSAVTGGRELESRSAYNAANAKVRLGEVLERTEPEAAMNKYSEALDYYKRAIDLDPEDLDAKFNYEFLEKRMQDLEREMEKEDQEEEEQQDSRDDKGEDDSEDPRDDKGEDDSEDPRDDKGEDDSEDPRDSDQDDSDRDPETPDDEGDELESEEDTASDDPSEDDKVDAESEPAVPDIDTIELGDQRPDLSEGEDPWDTGEMSREQAEMLLRQQQEEESRTRARERAERQDERPPVIKDW